MDIIKRHMFFILCGLIAVAGVALGATGMSRMKDVPEQMAQAEQLHRSLDSLRSAPNQRWIRAEEQRIEASKADYQQVVEQARKLNPYTPFLSGVFPDGNADKRREFRRAYGQQYDALMTKLRAGEPPTPLEIQEISGEIYRETQQKGYDFPDASRQWTPTGVLTLEGAKISPHARAAISLPKLRRTHVYVSPSDSTKPSFVFANGMHDVNALTAPSPEECWYAQVQLWIQQDVVDAIARINDEAADALAERENGPGPWVANLPIKDIISVRITDEYVGEGTVAYSPVEGTTDTARSVARPPSSSAYTFTHSESNGDFQVLHFSVRLVMDQRLIPRFIQELSKDRFHALLRVEYRAVEMNPEMQGYIYGSDAAVYATFDFETHMLESFWDMMPFEVYKKYFPE